MPFCFTVIMSVIIVLGSFYAGWFSWNDFWVSDNNIFVWTEASILNTIYDTVSNTPIMHCGRSVEITNCEVKTSRNQIVLLIPNCMNSWNFEYLWQGRIKGRLANTFTYTFGSMCMMMFNLIFQNRQK